MVVAHPLSHWRLWLSSASGVLAPDSCGFCGSAPSDGLTALCPACFDRIASERYPACGQCSAVLAAPMPRCGACLATKDHPLRGAMALFRYQGIGRTVIHKLKRDADGVIARSLAEAWRLQANEQTENRWLDSVEMVACIPQRPRFFWEPKNVGPTNLALAIATSLGVPANPRALKVRKWLRRQHELSVRQRQVNVRRAFRVDARADIKGRAVLLVDDVMTSGATICSAAQCLLDFGAREVWGAVAARGQAFGAVHPYAGRPKSA